VFHLLVSYQGWPEGGGEIPSARIYIRSEKASDESFMSKGKLNPTKISQIPALLVTETGGSGPQQARVAYITSVAQGSRETRLQYSIDGSIRPISNAALSAFSAQMGLGRFDLTHTHWQIVDADLFRILLLNQQSQAIKPNVFSFESINRQERDLVSVMMPFRAEFKKTFSKLKMISKGLGLRCVRADDIWENHAVIQDIVDLVAKARVVVCDCTGKNANVFYETGIAHSLGKEVVLITQSDDDIPFDLRHLRYIKYHPNAQGLRELAKAVEFKLNSIIAAS
jgi:hypothetical protein